MKKIKKLTSSVLAFNICLGLNCPAFASKDVPLGGELQEIRNHFAKSGGSDDYEMDIVPITYVSERTNPEDHRTLVVKNAPGLMSTSWKLKREHLKFMDEAGRVNYEQFSDEMVNGNFLNAILNIMADSEYVCNCNKVLLDRGIEKFFETCNNQIKKLVGSTEYGPVVEQISANFGLSPEESKEMIIATMSVTGIARLAASGAITLEALALGLGTAFCFLNPAVGIAVSFVLGACAGIAGAVGNDASKVRIQNEIFGNCSKVLYDVYKMMINQPEQVKRANCFMMGIDFRGRALKWCENAIEAKGLGNKVKAYFINPFVGGIAADIHKNQGSWCDFRYVKNLPNADRMVEFTQRNVRPIDFYIDVARRLGRGKGSDITAARNVLKGITSPQLLLTESERQLTQQKPEDMCPVV